MSSLTRIPAAAAFITLASLTGGCGDLPLIQPTPRVVSKSTDIANVFVTALPPMAFSDIQASLAIQHGLTAADCRALAAQTTGSNLYQVISQVALGASLALPQRTATNSTTTTNGSATTSGVVTTGSATIPSSSGAPANAISATSLAPDLTKPAPPFGLDGAAQIMGSNALCQTAALLQQQILSAKIPDGYNAHVVTFQVNVQPQARDLSYDTAIDIELWPAGSVSKTNQQNNQAKGAQDNKVKGERNDQAKGALEEAAVWARPPIFVKPLIITDVIESTSIARSVEALQQFSASLSGVLPSLAGINIGGSNAREQLNAALGADRNSVLTMGTPTNHMMRIYLGAPSSGSYKFAMVPRTFNVSVLVLRKKPVDDLLYVSRSTFRSTDSSVSQSPTDPSRPDIALLVKRKVCGYGMQLVASPYCRGEANSCGDPESRKGPVSLSDTERKRPDPLLDVLRHIDRQDRSYLDSCLKPTQASEPAACDADPSTKSVCIAEHRFSEENLRIRLYSELSEIKVASRYTTSVIAFPSNQSTKYPFEDQVVAVADDGKSMTLSMSGGRQVDPRALYAYAVLDSSACTSKKTCILNATSVSASGDGSALTIAFPSLTQLKLASSALKSVRFNLDVDAPDAATTCASESRTETERRLYCYDNFAFVPADPEKANLGSASIASATQFVTASANGVGSVKISVDVKKVIESDAKVAGSSGKIQMPVSLSIKGASITDANTSSSVMVFGSKGISVTGSGTASIQLGNLVPGQPISLQIKDAAGKVDLSAPLTLSVVPSLAKN